MSDSKKKKILSKINSPADLKQLKEKELIRLCDELREFIIDAVSLNPGHFGASLGVVELTVALHYVFNTPFDKLVWDVGHQAYAHKILTGRRDQFYTNRKYKGISGFPKISESEYDAFGVGHSSTSISAALGMAQASFIIGEKGRQHIAVIGDASITSGQAFEALNNAGVSNTNILVILNDNGIAIDKSVGALNEYLTDITTSETYNKVKDRIWNFLGARKRGGQRIRRWIQQFENAIKLTLIRRSNVFESLRFRYFGPVNGHDLIRLIRILEDLKKIPGPKLLHCITVKGKGFIHAEKNKTKFHAPGLFDKETGEIIDTGKGNNYPPKYQVVFGETLVELARLNPLIVGVTPAMASGCSLDIMMKELPSRAYDVGISEQHAVTFSAGLAIQGMIPFCNIYSTFMQRAYDQVIHDVAVQKLHVVFCLDRGGLVGEDGVTHHGVFDLAYFRCIPDMIIASPMNEEELRNMMFTAQSDSFGPFVIRYPRGNGVMINWRTPFRKLEIGKGRKISDGKEIAFISIGHIGNDVAEAVKQLQQQGISAAHYDVRFLKPLDENLLHDVFSSYKKVITVEDGTVVGGLGCAVTEFMVEHNYQSVVKKIGVPDRFVQHGTLNELHHECGYSIDDMIEAAKKLMV